ncbi:hypothetical protein LJB94_03300, partial [Odoribacter sp. OttesenSCG-928-G04]|nr:hypothetical protein [Odoribacter sp. OttesenSCG-928-G04]
KWGENWGVVETDEHNKASIVLLDRQFKEELLRIPALPDELFVHPSYNGKEIVTIAVSPQGNRILSINPQTRERTPLTEYVWCELDNPLSIDSSLYFRASWEGNNTLYRQDRTSDKTHAVLNAPFGVRFPAVNPQQDILYFSFYTSEGYKPGKIEMQLLQEGIFQPKSYALADSLVKYEEAKIDNMGDSIYESRRYRKLPHLLNVHSWGPMYVNQFDEEIDFGLIVYSQNKLSTLSLSAGFVRTGRYEDGAWVLNATYKGLWPKFSLDMKTSRPDDKRFYGITTEYIPSGESDSLLLRAKHRYSEAELTVSFPFNLSGRNYYRSVLPYIRYKMEAIHDYSIKNAYRYYFIGDTIKAWEVDKADYTLSIPSNFYQALEYGIRIANYTYTTEQEINPKWGQIIQAGYRHTPWKKLKLGEQWWVSGLFYLPGFYTNHSLSLYGGFQKAPDNNAYSNNVMSARGIGAYRSDMFTIRTTYQFPLVYPDWNFAGLVYIKALKGGLFFDYMQQQPKNKKIHNHSYGVELTADCHFLRLPFPINIGLRAGYESRTESLFADFLFNVGFYF